MVVLEGGGLLSSGGNQYLQPDYLSPLPTTLDAKKSPLALLAQTCSQIGADSPNTKPLLSSLEKKKSESRNSPVVHNKSDKNVHRTTPSETKLVFKPYETNVVSKKIEDSRPNSQKSVDNDKKSPYTGSDRKSVSPSVHTNSNSASNTPSLEAGKNSPESQQQQQQVKSSTPSASPIIRSGLEILQAQSKEASLAGYKSLAGTLPSSLNPLCCPPGLELAANPAFRPPYPGAAYSHHHSMLGYPGTNPGPFVSFARMKTASGAEALVPVCKDPYCSGCQFSVQNQQLINNAVAAATALGPCPSGCNQCDHQKYNLSMPMSLAPPTSLAYPSLGGRPYVCNWICGDSFCGKRFVTSEELLLHLRSHTNTSDPASAANLLNHQTMLSTAALRSGYANAPLSPLSAARYHPYAKPGLPTSLTASPYSAFNPASFPPYYSAYALYGQRLGSAAVHP